MYQDHILTWALFSVFDKLINYSVLLPQREALYTQFAKWYIQL